MSFIGIANNIWRATKGTGGGLAFNPLSLNPITFHDISDITTLFQDSAMTISVTANNDPVGAVVDKSGNAHHLLQATAGARPLYKVSGGLAWLEFDGVDDFLKATAFNLEHPFDRYMGARNISYIGGGGLWDGDAAAQSLTFQSGLDPDLSAFNGAQLNFSGEATNTDMVFSEQWNTATSRIAIDNNAYVSGNTGANPNSPDGYTIGARGNGAQFSNIRFYIGLQFNSTQTDANVAKLRTYIGAKEGRSL